MGSDVGESLKRLVANRAGYRCEYCLLHEDDCYYPHQLDHIISRKHGGLSNFENLAFACFRCNTWKGSDIGSFDSQTLAFVGLFNPRLQSWDDHFSLRGSLIEPLTGEGGVTARLLKFNIDKRVVERRRLAAVSGYPR